MNTSDTRAARIVTALVAAALLGVAVLALPTSASATVSSPRGGHGYAEGQCTDSAYHVAKIKVTMRADSGALPQTVAMRVRFYDPYQGQWFPVTGNQYTPFVFQTLGQVGAHEAVTTEFGGFFRTSRLPGQHQRRWFYIDYWWMFGGVYTAPTPGGEYLWFDC